LFLHESILAARAFAVVQNQIANGKVRLPEYTSDQAIKSFRWEKAVFLISILVLIDFKNPGTGV